MKISILIPDIALHLSPVLPDFSFGFRPNPDISIAEHAQKNLYLVAGKNPFPGLVDLDLTPYLYEILDSLMPDNGIEKVVLQKGWQTGGTLSALALCLWCFENSGSPVLYVFPNDELRNKFSKERLGPIIANCAALNGKVKELERYSQAKDKTRDTIISKVFPNGSFCNLATSLSPVSLRASSIAVVIFDEVSAFCDDSGGEGDPCTIALGRTSTYEGRKKLFYISTPSLKDQCRIEREYLTTDRRKYFVPCMSCGEMQLIVWKQIDFSEAVPFFRCIRCNYRHWEEDKTFLLKHGQWRPTATPMFENSRGYFLPALYAPIGMYSWKSCAEQFRKGCDNPVELKVFVNNILAETWEDRSVASLNPDDLANLVEDYEPAKILPKGAVLVTAGVDTHPNHYSVCTRAWSINGESWVLDYWVIYGDANMETTKARVNEKLQTTYRHHRGEVLRIAATCVDTGGHNTDAVYDFCRHRMGEFIIPIKGIGTPSAPIIDHPTFLKEENIYLFRVGKLATHGRLFSDLGQSLAMWKEHKNKIKNGIPSEYRGAQILHFHKGLDTSFFKELSAPKAKWVKRDGSFQLVYESTDGVADHAHDCLRYADAARHFLDINIDRLYEKLEGVNEDISGAA